MYIVKGLANTGILKCEHADHNGPGGLPRRKLRSKQTEAFNCAPEICTIMATTSGLIPEKQPEAGFTWDGNPV